MRIESTGAEALYRPPTTAGTLVVALDETVVQTVLVDERVVTIGRLPENAVPLPAPDVSRRHAEVRAQGGEVVIADLGSAAGTFVDSAKVGAGRPVPLSPGSRIRIGPYTLTYEAPAAVVPLTRYEPPPVVREPPGPVAPLDDTLPAVPARPTESPPRPAGPVSRYLQHLPAMFQDQQEFVDRAGQDGAREPSFLGRMLLIFEAVWEPLEQRQDHIEMYYDPRTCPADFLPWLASWLHLVLNPRWPEERRRRLLAEAMDLYRWRGTAYGLSRMIEVSTGLTPTVRDEPERPFTFHISVAIPAASDVRRETIEELVLLHKPAHVGYVLEVTPGGAT